MSRKTKKLMWSVPLIAAVAVIGALALFLTLEPNGAQAQDIMVPGPVTDLGAVAKSRTSIELDWEAPSSTSGGTPTGYRIDQSPYNLVWTQLIADTGSTATRKVLSDNISTATRLHFRVFAINEAGTGPVSKDPVTAFVDVRDDYPPVTPSRFTLTLSVQGPNQIDLSWTEPEDTGGQDITGYEVIEMVANATDGDPRVECGPLPATQDLTPEAVPLLPRHCLLIDADIQGTKRTVSHKNMTPGSAHYYRVIAMNGVDNGTPTDVKGARTTSPTRPDKPGSPVSVPIATAAMGSETINLYWNEPAKNGGHTLALHPVQGQRRTFDATTNRWNDWSSWADLRTANPADLEAVIGIGGSVKFAPAPPTTVPGTPSVTDPLTAIDTVGDAFNIEIMGVDHGTDDDAKAELKFRIRSMQNNDPEDKGLNLSSSWAEFNRGRAITLPVQDTVPLVPGLTAETLDDVDMIAEQGIRVEWTRADNNSPGNAEDDGPNPSDYRIDKSEDGVKWEPAQTQTARTSHWEHEGLKTNADWYYRVFPITGNRFGEAAIAGDIVAQAILANPDELLNLRQTGSTTTSITMTWNSVPQADSYDLYMVEENETTRLPDANSDGVPMWGTAKNMEGITYTDSKDLNPGDVRWYRAVAKDGDRVVPGTDGSEARGMTLEAGEPGTPIGLVTESAADSSFPTPNERGVLLLWAQPQDEGKDPHTSYRVEWKSDTETADAWETLVEDTQNLTNHVQEATHYHHEDELTENEQRAYQVKALSGSGAGMASNVSYYPPMASMAELGMPGNAMSLMAGSSDDNDPGVIKLTWEAGTNATTHTVAGVLRNADGTFDTSAAIWMTDVTSPLKVEMGDRPEGTYIFGVVAGLIDGTDREWSDWARATVAYPQ